MAEREREREREREERGHGGLDGTGKHEVQYRKNLQKLEDTRRKKENTLAKELSATTTEYQSLRVKFEANQSRKKIVESENRDLRQKLGVLLTARAVKSRSRGKEKTKGVSSMPVHTLEEVQKHSSEKDCWVILNDNVYDVTEFLPDHPGGKKAILVYAGKDATEEFEMLHAPNVLRKYLPKEALVGTVGSASNL